METMVLLLFAGILTGCVLLNLPILLALVMGLALFFSYGLLRHHTLPSLLKMALSGVRTVKNILLLFLLIGLLTALWRTAGTIPAIVCCAAELIHPSLMVLMAFLLNCLVSFLTGTAFGTAATMGVISMTMAVSMGIAPSLAGGAILSGAYFGDRCSPVSTSALLVSELTGTDIFENIREMVKTALFPFLFTCGIYGALGLVSAPGVPEGEGVQSLFAAQFRLGWIPLLPAVLILVLALGKVNVKRSISLSILAALIISLFYQGAEPLPLLRAALLGYRCPESALAVMLNGGGVLSMAKPAAIVCLSSCYAGIFEGTGLLNHLKAGIRRLSGRVCVFACILGTSAAASVVACNQTLTIMLTEQICRELEPDRKKLAIALENTAVVIPPLIPWSIAGAVPLASIGAPSASLLLACYLYILPLWNLFVPWGRGSFVPANKEKPT